MRHKKYKTSNLSVNSNKNEEEKQGSYEKEQYELVIDGDSVYEIDKECIACLKRQKSKNSNSS